jgi:hypothetical protein
MGQVIGITCCAPPLSDELLDQYSNHIHQLPEGPIKDACWELWGACRLWWDLPESEAPPEHWHGTEIKVVKLTADIQVKLYDVLPWPHTIDGIEKLFDTISAETEKPLRDMAHHLLWHVKELSIHEREPITLDKL